MSPGTGSPNYHVTAPGFSGNEADESWDGTNSAGQAVPSGVYFYRMEAGNSTDTKKLLITL